MIYFASLILVISLIMIVVIHKVENKDNPGINIVLYLTGFLYAAAILAVVIIFSPKEKSCLEYLRGNLEVKYEKVYVDSMLVRTDTIIEFKKR